MTRWILLLVLVFTFNGKLFPQFQITPNGYRVYEDILALRFEAAESKLNSDNVSEPTNQFAVYLENYQDFLSVFISEDEEMYQNLKSKKNERIEYLKTIDKNSAYACYLLGNAYLQWAFVEIKFEDYVTAAFDFNRAYQLIEENETAFPDFVPNDISRGVLSVMVGLVPDNYRWFLNLLSIKGSTEEGRRLIYKAYQKSITDPQYAYLADESLFYLAFIDLNIKPEKKNVAQLLEMIGEKDENNLLLSYLAINLMMRNGQNDQALDQFTITENRTDFYPFFYLDYLNAECLIRKLNYSRSTDYYNKFLKHFTGRNYIKDAIRKKAWASLLDGDTITYRQLMKEVPSNGFQNVDIDKEAEMEALSGEIPNIELLKARLLFDGGYLEKSKNVLKNILQQNLSLTEKVECDYRLARIYHELGKSEDAKLYYSQTLLKGKNLRKYYAGNSALKLGEIYESEGNNERAAEYYTTCLQLEFDEYETSIHSKAKAGLDRLND